MTKFLVGCLLLATLASCANTQTANDNANTSNSGTQTLNNEALADLLNQLDANNLDVTGNLNAKSNTQINNTNSRSAKKL